MSGFAAADYCVPETQLGTVQGDYLARVLLTGNSTTLDSITTGDTPAPHYYFYYTGLSVTGLAVTPPTVPTLTNNQQYTITLQVGIYPSGNGVAAWMDFNQDETFEASEKL